MVKEEETNYESHITGFKCNNECTRFVLREGNKSTKMLLIYLKISKQKKGMVGFSVGKYKKRFTADGL